MKIKDVMTTDVVTASPSTPIKEAATLLARNGVSGLPVVDDQGRVVGVFSEADVLVKEEGEEERKHGLLAWLFEPADPAFEAKLEATVVDEAMTAPAMTIDGESPVREAAAQMLNYGINRLPVVDDDGRLVGIVTRADLVRAFTRSDQEIAHEIEEDVLRHTLWLEPGAIEVGVEAGAVTLEGTVETRKDAELLERFVHRVPGVVSVQSEVRYRVDEGR